MKKLITLLLSASMIITLVSCTDIATSSTDIPATTDEPTTATTTTTTSNTNKTTTAKKSTTTTTTKKPTTTTTTTTTTEKPTTTITTTTTTNKPFIPQLTSRTSSYEDLETAYQNGLSELNSAYNMYMEEIEMEFMNIRVNCAMSRQNFEAEIARLQGEWLAESIEYQRQISDLELKRIEAQQLGATNSYYTTLAKQYQSQISNLNSQFKQAENKYNKQISSIKQQIEELPTDEEISLVEKSKYESLNAWYQEELAGLNEYYGK